MWEYRAALVRVVDGDSLVLLMDTGFGGRQEEEVRLLDVHAPERSEPGGPETAQFVTGWLAAVDPGRRWPLVVRTDPSSTREPTERRSFVRYLATVCRAGVSGRSLNDDVTAFLAAHPGWGPGR